MFFQSALLRKNAVRFFFAKSSVWVVLGILFLGNGFFAQLSSIVAQEISSPVDTEETQVQSEFETEPQTESKPTTAELRKPFTGRAFWGNVVGINDENDENEDQPQKAAANAPPSLLTLKAHTGPVENVAFTRDYHNLFSCGTDRQIIFWNAVSGEEVRRFLGNRGPITGISVGKEGQFFASCSTLDRRVLLWNILTGTSILEYPSPPFEPSALALGSDASVLIVGQRDGNISVYRNSAESPIPQIDTFKGHLLAVNKIVLSPEEKRFLSCGNDQTITIWSTQTREKILTFKEHRGAVLCADFAPVGNFIVSAGKDRSLILWNSETGQEIKRFQGHQSDVTSVAFNEDASQIISASKDRTVILWDVKTGDRLKISQKRNSPILCAAVNQLNGDVALSCVNGIVEILPAFARIEVKSETETSAAQKKPGPDKTQDGDSPSDAPEIDESQLSVQDRFSRRMSKFLHLPHGKITQRLGRANDYSDFGSISPNGFYFASINSQRGDGMLWNVDTGKEIRLLQTAQRFSAVCFHSRDSRFLFTGTKNGAIQYWNLRLEKIVADIPGHASPVQAIAVSKDGKHLLTGAKDGSVILWNLLERKKIRTLSSGKEIGSLEFSPDGKHFAVGGSDNIVRVWDVETFTEIQLHGHRLGKISVAFLPNNRQVVSGASDGKIILWDISTKKSVKEIATQTEVIQSLALAPNGKFLITGGKAEEFSLIWDVERLAADTPANAKPIMLLPFQGGPITDIVFHPKYWAVITLGGRTPVYWSISTIVE